MEAFYAEIKLTHLFAVLASGSLFFVRGFALNVFGASWAMAAPLRYLSYSIDTVLLTAALMLMTIVRQYPFIDAWITVKVLLLVVYVVLGSFALKRGKTLDIRLAAWVAALAVFAFIASVARAHNPWGLFTML